MLVFYETWYTHIECWDVTAKNLFVFFTFRKCLFDESIWSAYMHSYIHAPRILWMKDRHIDTIWWNHMVCKYNEPPQRIWNLPGAILLTLDLIFIKLKVQVSGGDQDSKNPFPSVYFEQKCYLVLRTKEIPFYMRWCVWKEQALRGITESLLPMPFRRWSALLLMFSCKQEMWLRMAKQWVRKGEKAEANPRRPFPFFVPILPPTPYHYHSRALHTW
jgi:hypothetical protein